MPHIFPLETNIRHYNRQSPSGGCGFSFYLLINVEKILHASVECQLTPTSIFVIVKLHIWESS